MTAINHALEAAIHRAVAIGRVDVSIQVAAEQLRAMVRAEPNITPGEVLRRCDVSAGWRSNDSDWDTALWTVADIWCDLQRELMGHPARQAPASPYSILRPGSGGGRNPKMRLPARRGQPGRQPKRYHFHGSRPKGEFRTMTRSNRRYRGIVCRFKGIATGVFARRVRVC